MKNYIYSLTLISTILFSCNENNSSNEKTTDSTIKPDSLINLSKPDTLKSSDKGNLSMTAPEKDTATTLTNTNSFKIKTGLHNISIQWISFDRPGKAMVSVLKEGGYKIEGKQEGEEGDYLSIKGSLRVVSEKELEFDGVISSKIGIINKGAACIRKGKYSFIAPSNKKYWRLKEKINCEGGMVTDLIDIQF